MTLVCTSSIRLKAESSGNRLHLLLGTQQEAKHLQSVQTMNDRDDLRARAGQLVAV